MIENGTVLYGTTFDFDPSRLTVFSFDLATGTFKTLHKFRNGPCPVGALTYYTGALFGAAATTKGKVGYIFKLQL